MIHIYMEMSQGNSLCSYLKQAKMSFVFLLQNWRSGELSRFYLGVGRVSISGRGGTGGERV
jgi:hypothetical protein